MRRRAGLLVVAPLVWCLVATACGRLADYPYIVEGRPHAEAVVAAVSREWNADELIKHADAQMLEALPVHKLREMVDTSSRELGPAKSQRTMLSEIAFGAPGGKYASYLIQLECQKGRGRVRINLHKVASAWTVMGFWVELGKPAPEEAMESGARGCRTRG